jgi:hypothetical protein
MSWTGVWAQHRQHCHHIDGLSESMKLSVERLYARLADMIVEGYSEQLAEIEKVRDVLDQMLAGVVLYRAGLDRLEHESREALGQLSRKYRESDGQTETRPSPIVTAKTELRRQGRSIGRNRV